MSRTTKPCPACKEVVRTRPADDICASCRKLIEEALEYRDAARTAEGTEVVRLPWAPHGMAYIPNSSRAFGEDHGDQIRKALYKILRKVGTPSRGESGHNVPVVIGGGGYDRKDVYRYPVGLRPLFDTLYENIVAVGEGAYRRGYDDGHRMLVRLAKGEMSLENFNEIGAGGELDKPGRKRRA